MRKIWEIFDEEKEEEKIGWSQRMRGIGVVPEIKPKSPIWDIFGEAGAGIGAKAGISLPPLKPEEEPKTLLEQIGVKPPTRPEELKMGIEVALGTWEEQKRARPELQDVEDFGNEVFKQVGERNQIAYIHEALTGVPKAETLKEMDANWEKFKDINPDIDDRTWKEYFKQEGFWKTLITGPTKGKYDEAVRLHRQLEDIAMRVAEPGKDLIGQLGWKGMILLMGAQVTDAVYRSGLVVKEKWVTGEKLKAAVERARAAYIPETGKFKATLSGSDLAVVNRLKDVYRVTGGKIENIGLVKEWGVTEKGIKVPQVTFLYAGPPADEIVKSLVKTGKVTADIARELSLAKPELVSQVIQNLSVASPAIAAKLGPELTKLIPKIEPEKPIIPEEPESLAEEMDELKETIIREFESGKKNQSWEVAPKNKLLRIYKEQAEGLIKSEKDLDNIWLLFRENLQKILVDTGILLSGYIDDSNFDRWLEYTNFPKERGQAKFTLSEDKLNTALVKINNARTTQEKLLAIDYTLNIVHGRGSIANWFVKGGIDTLDELSGIPKVEPKPPVEPTIPRLTEKEIVPDTIEKAKEILKVDPKKPSVPKIKLAEEMVKKKVSLVDIEAVKGEKIDVKEPRDIIIALRDIKAIKKEVIVKPKVPEKLQDLKYPQKISETVSKIEAIVGRDLEELHLVGSQVTGKATPKSDIDLFAKVKGDPAEVEKLIKENYKGTPISIQVSKMSLEEAAKGIPEARPSKLIYQKVVREEVPRAEVKKPIISKEEIAPELKRVIEIKEETEKAQKKLIDEKVLELKEEGFKGVEKGGVKRDEEGKVVGRYPAVSRNPKWYRDFYAEHETQPTLTDLKEIAKEQLLHGHEEDYGIVPPSKIFQKIDSQLVDIKILLSGYAEYPAKIIKEEVEELKPLATPAQIKKAHDIADTKALISEKGKMKPQYRKIAEVFTGKRSVKDMTPEEAETFIDMLDRLPEPKYKAGKLVPPSIPRTMKLTTLDFFKKVYGEPTPVWLLTDQTYYATKLGIKLLVEPFEKGKQEFDLEFRQSSKLIDKMVDKLNTIAGTSAFAKIKSKVKNVPTKAESNMAELVNKYEATPPGLSPKEEDVFKYFRNLGKDIWRRENEVREKVDLPPIKYKTAYFKHTADAMAKEMLEGKYPFPQGIKYWGEKMVGKKIFNPMEFHRKLSDDLIDLWSKDIRAVTKGMLWSGLKEIYLAQPAKFLNEQLNAISKDLPEYKNLSPRDQAAYDQTRVIPASTKKWLVNYVNQVLKGQETELDASLNRIVTNSGLKGIFDKVLSPFGRSIGRRPITHIFQLSGRAVISGVMGWVPRQIMRNAFQPVQNLALYGVKATIKAFLPSSVDKNLKGLMTESLFLKSYTGFEELPTNLMGKLEKVWLGPYGIVAVNNAKLGMKAAYWNTIELIRNPKFKKHGWADPQRTKDTPKGFLYTSEKEKLLREMEFGASATQYQYIPMGMPGVFRYKALVPLTRLQSWWMNYFTKFNREAIHRGLKGRPSWSGEDGPTLPWSRRVNYLKYLVIGGAILTALGYKRSFMLGVLPVYVSPAGQVALGIYNYATATEDWQKKKALNQIYYSWKAFIPGSLAWRDFVAVWKGEKDLEEILFYGKKEEKKVAPKSDIWEEMEEKKTKETKSEVWETFD